VFGISHLSDGFSGLRKGVFWLIVAFRRAKMRQKSQSNKPSSEQVAKGMRRVTRKRYAAEEGIRIVLHGLRGEMTIAELCRREGIAEALCYSWSREFLVAGNQRRGQDLLHQSQELKEVVAEPALKPRLPRKSMIADGGDETRGAKNLPTFRISGNLLRR
jgi:transposase